MIRQIRLTENPARTAVKILVGKSFPRVEAELPDMKDHCRIQRPEYRSRWLLRDGRRNSVLKANLGVVFMKGLL